jgi:hypothetical protein
MALMDRTEAWRDLDRLLTDSELGRGRVVLVGGGLACGKTELCHAFADHAAAAGATVLTAIGAPEETSVRLGVVRQLLRGKALPADVEARAARLVTNDLLAATAAEPVDARDALVVHELCALLLELATHQPLVVLVDDIQFADQASLAVVLSLCRRVRSTPILIVLTEWARARPTQPLVHGAAATGSISVRCPKPPSPRSSPGGCRAPPRPVSRPPATS